MLFIPVLHSVAHISHVEALFEDFVGYPEVTTNADSIDEIALEYLVILADLIDCGITYVSILNESFYGFSGPKVLRSHHVSTSGRVADSIRVNLSQWNFR